MRKDIAFLGQKKPFSEQKTLVLSIFSILFLRLRGTGEERAFQTTWTLVLVVVIQVTVANSVATSACFTEFFINGIERFLSSLFNCVSRDKKANGN